MTFPPTCPRREPDCRKSLFFWWLPSRGLPAVSRIVAWAIGLIFSLGWIGQGYAAEDGNRPNIVILLSDDQAYGDYSFMGHPIIQTPSLDKLASQSLVYTRGYVPTSLCRPSLMSLATGLYPHQHKVTGNDPPKGTDRREMLRHVAAVPTLPRLLAAEGYQCLQTGKWWEGSYREGGFTHGMTHGEPARGGRHGDVGLKIGREGLEPIFQFIRQCQGKPFFVWYAPMMPHSPHTPPERLLARYALPGRSVHEARYYAMCQWWDETCGQLLDFLEEEKLAENTLVVYLTDNGWIQNPDSPQYLPKSKRSPYEGGVRTPIMLRWPGRIAPQRDEQSLAQSIDIAPTLLRVCGLKPTPEMPGLNLLPSEGATAAGSAGTATSGATAAAGKAEVASRRLLFGEIFTHDLVDLDQPAKNLLFRWCIAAPAPEQKEIWKLIVPHPSPRTVELYDLSSDRQEERNLAQAGDPSHQEVVDRLLKELDAWWQPEAQP